MTRLGKALFTIIVIVVAGFGVWNWYSESQKPKRDDPNLSNNAASTPTPGSASGTPISAESLGLAETLQKPAILAAAAPYTPKNKTVEIEISEYAGYSGIIAANGGLEPNEDSYFYKNFGFKLKITVSEEESWSALNSGKIGASVTTVDVLAVYGRQLSVVTPLQIGFSRGADGIVVERSVRRVNDLQGKTLVTAQFTEADFFLRYLAQEAGIKVNLLETLEAERDAAAVNLLFTGEGFAAGDAFLKCLQANSKLLNGCVTWAPKTTETAEQSNDRAYILTTNRNLLIIADILILNRGFAEANPAIVKGLTEGILAGNKMMRDDQTRQAIVAKALGWTPEEIADELKSVHLANLPENLAFFSGAIDAAGSYNGIYQSAIMAYGPSQIPQPVDGERFLSLDALNQIQAEGKFAGQQIAIQPIRSNVGGRVETDPLLSKDIRFLFEPNSDNLDLRDPGNLANLETIIKMLKISPGSTILLRGHVDNAQVKEFEKQGSDFVRNMALKAVDLSKRRAQGVQRALLEKYGINKDRTEVVGRGWDEPVKPEGGDENRRVEAQWFTIE